MILNTVKAFPAFTQVKDHVSSCMPQVRDHVIYCLPQVKDHVSYCKHSMIIFDEVDKLPAGTLDVISHLLDTNYQIDGTDYR